MRLFLILLLITISTTLQYSSALECYTGKSFVRGQSTSTETEVCKKPTDKCLKASAEGNSLMKLKLTGCSTVRCMAARDGCIEQNIGGQRVQLCCCNTDRCNGKQKSLAGGIASGLFDKLVNRGSNNNNQN